MSFILTKEQLAELIPGNKYLDQWYDALESCLPDYDINTPQRVASFIAQCAHESGGFKILKENLNYRWQTLRSIFPKYFPTDEIAQRYASLPNKAEAIANKVYSNRMGNGPEDSGDGFQFCGRGLIQLTGRTNYEDFAMSIETPVEEMPEYLQTFEGAVQSACWFWETRGLNAYADKGDIKGMTKKINGGYIGLEDRIKHYNHALHVIGVM
jgi:putative chitinase